MEGVEIIAQRCFDLCQSCLARFGAQQAARETMEAVRDRFFDLLDRFNPKARGGKASAFPPGRPRPRAVNQAGS